MKVAATHLDQCDIQTNFAEKVSSPLLAVVSLSISLIIASCGGGGSAGSDGVNTNLINPSSPPIKMMPIEIDRKTLSDAYDSYMNFERQKALRLINAAEAYVNLETSVATVSPNPNNIPTVKPGAGVAVGLIDSGIDRNHPTFSGASIRHFILDGGGDQGPVKYSHGTSVASVIASVPTALGVQEDQRFGGLAYGADITMYATLVSTDSADLAQSTANYEPVSLSALRNNWDRSTARRIGRAIDDGIDFLNMSIGISGLIEDDLYRNLENHLPNLIETLAQEGSLSKTIVVRSAGNANLQINATSPEILAGLPARIPKLREVQVAVVSVDLNGTILRDSNRCGIAQDSCIAAPGSNIYVAEYSNQNNRMVRSFSFSQSSGTSFAAPMVTGGLALMKQIFRGQLSNTALLSRLYATAKKTGRHANRAVYGQGLMDLGQATRPLGRQTLATGMMVSDGGFDLFNSEWLVSDAFGDSLTHALADQEVAVFDSLGAPFWHPLSGRVRSRTGSDSLVNRLTRWKQSASAKYRADKTPSFTTDIQGVALGVHPQNEGWQIGRLQMRAHAGVGLLSLAEPALALSYSRPQFTLGAYTSSNTQQKRPISGMMMDWRMKSSPVSFRAGIHHERSSLLGSQASGAFGNIGTQSIAVGVASTFNWGEWQVGTEAEIGRMVPKTGDGIIAGINDLWTSGFVLHSTRPVGVSDRVTISISQPLRVESGHLAMSIPVGRTPDNLVLRSALNMDLEPSGRQLDLTVGWERTLSTTGGFMLEGRLQHQTRHSDRASTQMRLMGGWRQRF